MHYVKQGLFEMHNGIFQVPYFYQVYDPKGQRKVNTNIIIQSQTPDQLYVYAWNTFTRILEILHGIPAKGPRAMEFGRRLGEDEIKPY